MSTMATTTMVTTTTTTTGARERSSTEGESAGLKVMTIIDGSVRLLVSNQVLEPIVIAYFVYLV